MAKKKNKKTNKKTAKKAPFAKSATFPFKPIGDRVLVRELKSDVHEKSPSGIYLPTSEKDSGAKKGTVVAVGQGKIDSGALVPIGVTVGEVVLFQWGEKIEVNGEEYFLVREGEILGILA